MDWYHEFQVYAAKGWAVFFCNPRGSTGYGEKFERGDRERSGAARTYQDVMAGVDAALEANPWIDTRSAGRDRRQLRRLHDQLDRRPYQSLQGRGHAAQHRRTSSATKARATAPTDTSDDFGGDLFEKFDQYWDASPLKYAKNVKTPILILHSDNDFRVPLEQGEQWFRALQALTA